MAGIIAHEIGHDNFHHPGRTMTRQFFWVIGVSKVNSYEETKRDFAKFVTAYNPEHNPWPALGEAISGIGRTDELSADKAAFYFFTKLATIRWRWPTSFIALLIRPCRT